MQMKFAKKHPDALTPMYMTEGAACFDIFALVEGDAVVIPPGQAVAVRTGLAVEIPSGWRLDVVSRSGLWFKQRVRVAQGRGTIDHDYRGEIMVSLENAGAEPFVIRQHDRIAQGELNKVTRVEFVECALEELTETERGEGGFGSTGVSA